MLKKITTIVLALVTGLGEPVQIFAEEQTQATPVPTEEATTDLEGGISQGYPTPTPEEDATATDETPDEATDASPDANGENADGNTGENTEGNESRVKASFKEGVEQQEDGTFVWNVNPDEEEHTFAYRVELSQLDQAQVKVLVPSTVFRDGEEGDFIASDLEAESSKLHLKVYEIQTAEDGTETKLEVKNEPRKEAPTDGVSAIAEANQEVVQETTSPDTSVIGNEESSEDTDEGEKTEVKYSTNYVAQLAEESGILQIKACVEAPLETSVIQVEYTVEEGIYGNVNPQVFTAIADIGDENSDGFVECESNELEFVKNDGGKELKKDNNVGVVKDKATDNVATTYTVTYNAGDGQFDGGSKTNAIKYNVISNPVTKYSHTSNLSDDGTKKSNYGNNEKKTEVVTIPGADQLTVIVTYGGESKSYDWLSIFSGNHPGYTAAGDYSKADIVQKLGGGTHTDSSNTVTYTVQGDSVTFAWKTDSSGCGEGYGYYAKIVWSGRTMSGAYKQPTPPTKKKLDGWATTKGGTVAYPKTGIPDTAKITSNLSLYAVYSDFQWYDDWKYTLDNTAHTILLKKYNGDETTYTIPSSANIDGTTYTTTIGGWSYEYTLAHLDTGTITILSFQTGIKIYDNSLLNLFYKMQNLKSINFSNVDTSNVTNMYKMFYGCKNLTTLDVSHFNTNKVTDMGNMFCGCSSLTTLDVSRFNTSNVKNMYGVFCQCSNLTSLNLSNFDTSKVTNMNNMFSWCSNLTTLNVSNFNTSKVTNMSGMFSNCSNLPTLDVSGFNTSTVTNMSSMFNGCKNLDSLNVSGFDTSKVTSMSDMFFECSKLTILDGSHFNTGNVTNMSYMFYDCKNLTTLDVSHFNTSNVTNMNSMFFCCSNLTLLNLSNFDTSKVTNMSDMFSLCSSLTELEIGPSMKFLGDSYINDTNYGTYTGKWKLNNTGTAIDLITQYDGSKPGTYYREGVEFTYNLQYISKSGIGLGTATVSGTYGSSKNVVAPAKTGYSTPSAQNIVFDSKYGKTITFTYTPVNYTIAYDVNGGNSLSGQRTTYNVESSAYTLPTPTRAGHDFTGWTGSNGSTAQTSVVLAKGTTGNKSYTASWKPNTVYIAYGVNGGTVNSSTYSVNQYGYVQNASNNPWFHSVQYGKKDDMYNASTLGLTKKGYTFAYWQNEKTGTKYQQDDVYESTNFYGDNTSQTTANTADVRCYVKAIWAPIDYAITYDLAGGSISGQKTSYNIETANFTLPTPVRKGYTFAGWTGTGLSSATKSVTVAKGSTGARSYTATWAKDTYTISYNLNGGSATGNPTSYQVDSADITLKNPSKTGYSFAGWTGSNGSTAQTTVKIAKGSTGNKSYTANWTANTYTYNIKYVSKSGVALGTATVSGTFGSSKNVTAPAKTGYSTPVAQNVAFDSVNAKTITFTYTPVDYAITYNLAGGSISGQKTSYNIETANFTLPTPTRSGYTFAGWTGTGLSSAAKSVTVTKGTTGARSYTATWTPANYTITYNLDGGSVSGQKTSYNIETADFTLPTPSKTGHTFLGWTGTGLSSATKTVTVAKGSTGNRSYTANWSINQYDIILKGDAGTESVTYGDKTYPLDATHSVTIRANYNTNTAVTYKVKSKYHIVSETGTSMSNTGGSWSNNIGKEGGTGGQTWTTCAFTRTITIKTASNQFTVAFNANTGTGTMNNQIVTNNANQKVNVNAFKKAGYTFKNWNTRADGTGNIYADSVAVDSIVASNGATVTLYAQWAKDTYTISYNLNGGSVSGNPTSYQVDTADITLKNPSKTGYSFAGWTGSNGSTAQTTVKIAKGSTGNKSYTANWTANTYTYNIKYVSKSGVSLGTATVSGTYGSSKNVTAPAKTGYSTPVAQNVAFDSVNAKTITFTYTPIDYTITYDVNGGNSLSGQRTTYNVESSAYTLPTPSRAGHDFTGWTGANGSTAQTSVVLAKGTTGNQSYKANWKAKTYTVTYNSNCTTSSGTMATDTVTYGTDYTAKANGFTRPGYKFAGWTENADGTGSNWTNWIGKPWTWTYTRSITLYAQWTPNKLTINYHNDGAQKWQQYPNKTDIDVINKDVVQTETVNYDGTYDHADAGLLNVGRFTKTGYHTAEAWKVGSKTSTTKVSDGDNTLETAKGQSVAKYLGQDLSKGNVTVDLYPVFIANTYTIKYDGNGANSGSTASSTHSYDTAKNLTANGYTRTDYAFTGWNTEKNGSGTSYTDKASVKNLTSTNGGTITLYAQWKSVTATLSKTNWNKIYDKKVTSFEKGTKTVAEAAATAGAVRIDDGTGAPVWAYKEGTKLCYVADVSKIFMPADSSYWFAYKEDGEYVNTAITSIDLSVMDTSKATNMSNMFNQCKNLLSLDVSKFNTSNVVYMTSMFSKCSKLTSLDLSNFDTSKVNDMNSMFANCSSLTILNISKFNTSNVEKMAAMFSGCSKLTALDVSKFSTGNVQDMFCMFYNCSSLTSLNVSGFDTKKVVNMCTMFGGCSKLTSLDVSNFNTSNVENMNSMFEGCSGLTSLDVSNFDTSKVTGMGWMFENCSKLTSLNTSNFSTGNVTNMISMFENCNALTSLDISSFDTSKVTNMNSMLSGDNKLISLKLGSKFSFKGDAKLPEAAKGISKGYTHKWTLSNPYNYAQARTNTELMNTYNGATEAGTWVWEKQTSSLKISNKVNGNMGSKTKSFSTTLSIPTMAGKSVDAVFVDNSGASSTKTITFDKSGKAVFILTGTSSVTVNKLIPGDAYTVSQSNESKDGYKQIASGTTGTIKADLIAQCSFTNTKGSTLPTGIEAWGTGAVIALIGALMLVVYFFVHRR